MHNFRKYFFILFFFFVGPVFSVTLSEWQRKINALPKNPTQFQDSAVSATNFFTSMHDVITCFNDQYENNHWLDAKKFTIDKPFAQKMIVNPQSSIYFFGDLHGNIQSLMQLITKLRTEKIIDDNFTIIKPSTYLIFLGDYVDRGWHGVEVLYTILQLKLANPDSVFMIRGNHEDLDLNAQFGFLDELRVKFGSQYSYDLVQYFYNHLPSVLYLGTDNDNIIQCCHGGIEIGYDPTTLLQDVHPNAFDRIDSFQRKETIRKLPTNIKQACISNLPTDEIANIVPASPTIPVHNGFLWNDFSLDKDTIINYIPGRGWVYGKNLTQFLINKYRIKAIIRAHQHHGPMLTLLRDNNGMATLWNGMVYTLLSSQPLGIQFPFASCCRVNVTTYFKGWKFETIAIPVA